MTMSDNVPGDYTMLHTVDRYTITMGTELADSHAEGD